MSRIREATPVAHPVDPRSEVFGVALRSAAKTVGDALRGPDLCEDELRAALARVVAHALAVADGTTPRPIALPPALPAVRALELLRRCFVRELSVVDEPIPPRQLLDILRALEHLQSRFETPPGAPLDPQLPGGLQGDSLDLVVEIAHDVRSPLTAILFMSDALRRGQSGPLSPTQAKQLALIYSATFGLSALANDLIAMARGRRLLDRRPIPFTVAEVLQSVRDIVQPVAEQKGLHIEIEGSDTETRVGYPLALSRVLTNLVANAVNVTNHGSVSIVARQVSADCVRFSVNDTGPGLPEEQRASLFEAFRPREDRESPRFSSAGLGLAICRKLVAAMGGTLEVESILNQGSRFFFELVLPHAATL